MNKHQKLLLALILCLVSLSPRGHGQAVEPDALTRADAVQKALDQNKMILLIVSDTNNCTSCVTLQYGTLPLTNNPPMRQFFQESFVYWACGPEQRPACTEYQTYVGSGSMPLPMFFIIDPHNPLTYTKFGAGGSAPLLFFNWLRTGLLQATKPRIAAPQPNETFPDKNIVVQGSSISTNVAIRGIYYRLNGGGWNYSTVPDGINWEVALNPAQVAASNVFQVYAVDVSLTGSQTNEVIFFNRPGKSPATVTLGDLAHLYDGTAKTAKATTTPAGLTVDVTYNGSTDGPIDAGSYTVIGTVNNPYYEGSATNTLVITGPDRTPVPLKMAFGPANKIVTLSWPTNAIGVKLQTSPVLPATNWQDVAASEMTNSAKVTIGGSNLFFRLKN